MYWIGISILSVYYCLNKLEFIRHAGFARGHAIFEDQVVFKIDSEIIAFAAVKNVEYRRGEELSIIYSKANPQQAYVFGFLGFWYEGLIFTVIPIAVWSAYVLAFVDPKKTLYCSLWAKKGAKRIWFETKGLNEKND